MIKINLGIRKELRFALCSQTVKTRRVTDTINVTKLLQGRATCNLPNEPHGRGATVTTLRAVSLKNRK